MSFSVILSKGGLGGSQGLRPAELLWTALHCIILHCTILYCPVIQFVDFLSRRVMVHRDFLSLSDPAKSVMWCHRGGGGGSESSTQKGSTYTKFSLIQNAQNFLTKYLRQIEN